MELSDFGKRLAQLRMNKDVSARNMSLSLCQSAGYINNIENGVNFPSMTMFFYICEYLEITPGEFFDTQTENPLKLSELNSAAKNLNEDQLSHLIAIAQGLH